MLPSFNPGLLPLFGSALHSPEIDFFGLFLPWGFIMAVLGFLLAWVITLFLEHLQLTRHIWHLPLFFVALVILCSCLLGLLFTP